MSSELRMLSCQLRQSVIQAFRHIARGGAVRQLRGVSRVAATLARAGALCMLLAFVADAINADILYAAIIGDVQFQDDPLILDSATDATSVVPASLAPHVNYFQLAKFHDSASKRFARRQIAHFHGTTIIEDVDSPTVLDGQTTATLTFTILDSRPDIPAGCPISLTTIDRTINYSRLLI